MERIAPLAKILAEANGIDWRNLSGSGEGGMIVEQDILNYLTRVMSGEEEPPPTPVDAPPPEWTGTELPAGAGLFGAGMPSADMLSSAGVDSDLAALVGQPQPVPQPAATHPEDDALEFELEDDEVVPPAAAASSPVASEEARAPLEQVADSVAVPQPEPVAARAETPAPAAAAAGGGVMAGLGSLLSRLYQQPAPAQPAPAAPEVPAAQASTPPQLDVEAPVAEVVVPAVSPESPRSEAPTEPVPATPVEAEVAAAPQTAKEQTPDPAAPEVALPVTAPLPAAETRTREAVWFGTYLRRDANLAPAAELRRQLVAALGQDVPLALLVARAAQRHAATLDLETVAVQDLGANQARTAQPGGLRDALAALERAHEGTPDLLVLDAGTLDLDDLHLPHTLTLSVGRVQEGRAALTLQGDVDPVRAARFLTDVAGTLEEPIILVL
ncbi:MAG: E3 binding domain-containing protein [Deinococcota bacterium]